jgi:single-strand DNA-binding protein
MNKATIIIDGHLGRDPELRYTPKGDPVTSLAVVVTERKKVNDQWQDGDKTWFKVSVWGKDAEPVAEHARKGDRVVVVGTIKLSTYEKNGVTKTVADVRADSCAICPKPLPSISQEKESAPW